MFGFEQAKEMKKLNPKTFTKILTQKVTCDSLVDLVCLKLKWPQHQRHLLLER